MADKALAFTKANSHYVDCGNPAALQSFTAITVTAWIYPTGSNLCQICSKNNNTGLRFRLENGSDASHAKLTYYGCYASGCTITAGDMTLNAWHFVCATSNATATKLYIDGSQVGSDGPAMASLNMSSETFYIGRVGSWGEYFAGTIDELAIYNTVLSATTIGTLYAAGAGTYVQATDAGLVAVWHMDEGTGTTTTDSKASIAGTLSGTTGTPSWVDGKVVQPTGKPYWYYTLLRR